MSEKNKETVQKGTVQPAIEDAISGVLSEDSLRNALEFIAYLKANEMTVGGALGGAEVGYKDKCACYMYFDGAWQAPGPWTIWTEGDYSREREDLPLDERTKEIAWENVNLCASCGGDCGPGKRKSIFGRDFDNVCGSVIAFTDPDAEALDCAKKLIAMRKRVIDDAKEG